MRLTERLLNLTLSGSEWVLWLLIVLSVLSVAVMVERAIHLASKKIDLEALGKELVDRLSHGDVAGARRALARWSGPEIEVALAGVDQFDHGPAAAGAAMASAKSRLRIGLERNLGVLGTLGNNAPFIGLFGTVLGIIRAFADLAKHEGGGASVVMTGISEALVATAVGLMVAIPAVVAFNHFQGRIRRTLGRVDATAQLVLTGMAKHAGDDEGEREAAGATASPSAPRAS